MALPSTEPEVIISPPALEQALLRSAPRPRPLPLLASAALHAAVLSLALFTPPWDGRVLRPQDYRVLPAPAKDRKLVWYKLDSRLPDISVGSTYSQRPPRARIRSEDLSIHASTPKAPPLDQLVFQPSTPPTLNSSLPLPNMAAFQTPPPPEAPPAPAAPAPAKPAPRRFTPPPARARPQPKPVELSEAPAQALESPAALGNLTAVVAGIRPVLGGVPALPEASRPASVSIGPNTGAGPAGGALNPSPTPGLELVTSGSGAGAGAGAGARPEFVSETVLFTRESVDQRRQSVSVPVRLAVVPPLAQKLFGDRTVYLVFLDRLNTRNYPAEILLWFAERGQTASGGQAMYAPVPFRQVDPFSPRSHISRPIKGSLRLAAVIGANGFLSGLRVVDTPDDRLNQPLLDAAARWTFLPALRGATRIAVDALFEIPLTLAPASAAAPAPGR